MPAYFSNFGSSGGGGGGTMVGPGTSTAGQITYFTGTDGETTGAGTPTYASSTGILLFPTANTANNNHLSFFSDGNTVGTIPGDSTVMLITGHDEIVLECGNNPAALTLPAVQIIRGGIVGVVGGDMHVTTAGKGYGAKEGTNGRQGIATLSSGTVTVSCNVITANSRIFLTAQSLGTVAIPTALAVTATSVGSSFTITSASATDTSVVAYEIFEPGN